MSARKGKQWLVRELPVNRGHTEVSVYLQVAAQVPSAGTKNTQSRVAFGAGADVAPAPVRPHAAGGARPFDPLKATGLGVQPGNRPLKDELS